MNIKNLSIKIILLFSFLFPCSMASAGSDKPFIVCIDPGHGGNDTGACDNGVKEKDINLAVALRLREDINRRLKGVKVVMTRSDDRFVTLQGRADIANKNKADLFISIHTNSVDAKNPNRKSVAGASVYALGLHKDKDNLNVAKRENAVIELEKDHNEKYSGFDPSKDESYIIFEMAQKKNLAQSLRFADFAQKQLVSVAERKDRGIKQAGFWVLWTTSMPAVLVELDFICNPSAAEYMSSTKGEKQMAEALCNAVEKYYNLSKKSTASYAPASNPSPASATRPVAAVNVKEVRDANVTSQTDGSVKLATVEKSKRTDTPPAQSNTRSSTTARKRRSASSRLSSEQRNIETSNIVVKSESDYLAKEEEKKVENPVKKETVKETPKERKKRLALEKKNKEKAQKEKEELKKKEAKTLAAASKKSNKQENNKSSDNKSTSKIVVKNSGSTAKTQQTAATTKSKTATTGQIQSRKSLNSKRNKQDN